MNRGGYEDEEPLFGDLWGNEDPEPEEAGEHDEASEGTGRSAARLADGLFLITDGPGAGSVSDRGEGTDIREAPTIPDREEALDGTLPLFIVHRPHKYAAAVPRLLAQLHSAAGGNLALGISSGIDAASPQAHAQFSGNCPAAAVRIIDPLGFLTDPADLRVKELSGRSVRWAPYLAGGPVSVGELLDMQRERGANLLLTSGRALDLTRASASVGEACDEGDDALAALKPGERLALNLTVSARWLQNESLLDTLLTDLIEQEQFDVWHVRVQWPSPARNWTQPTDEKLLAGYRKLAQVADDEDRRLLLPQTGLTGWLMLAWGAAGFGTGPFGSNQAFLEPTGGGQPGQKPAERYFERQLLHTVESTARRPVTSDPGYAQCRCPYCPPLLAGPAWSEEYAGLHCVYGHGLLAAQAAPAAAGRRGTHGAVGRTVRRAVRFARGKPLTGISAPAHLRTWDQLL